MKTDKNRTDLKKRRGKKVGVGIASVAVLMLITVLGLTYFNDGSTTKAGEKEQATADVNEPAEFNVKNKEIPDKTGQDEKQTEEPGQSNDANKESNDESKSDAEASNKDNNVKENKSDNQNQNENENEAEDTEKQPDVRELSDDIVEALDDRDMQTVAKHVHPKKGLVFSPYVYVTEDAVKFDKTEVSSMLDSNEPFVWGEYDGRGTPIEMTSAEYFDEFLDMEPYLQPDEVKVDDMQKRGNVKNNIKDVFPDATVIEYYNEGPKEYEGIDWKSLNLVYEKDEAGELKLVAIVRDMRTM